MASEKQPTAKGGKAKITKEVKAMTKAPKKKTSSSHPTYEEVQDSFLILELYFRIRNFFDFCC